MENMKLTSLALKIKIKRINQSTTTTTLHALTV
jgi:hypothetical protein